MKIRISLLCLSFILTILIFSHGLIAVGDEPFNESNIQENNIEDERVSAVEGESENKNELEQADLQDAFIENEATIIGVIPKEVIMDCILPLLSYQDAARFGLTCYRAQTFFKGSCHYTVLLQQMLMKTYSFKFYDYFRILRANPKQVRAITPALQGVLKLKVNDDLGRVLDFKKIFDDPRRLTECMQSLLESMASVLTQFCTPAEEMLEIEVENEAGEFYAPVETKPVQIEMLKKLEWLMAGAVCILRYGRLDSIGLSFCSDQKQKERMVILVAKLKESEFFQDFLKLLSERSSVFDNFHLDVYPDYHCCCDEDKQDIYLFFVMRFFAMIVSRTAELPPAERVNVFQVTDTYRRAWKLESFFAECDDPLLLEMLVELLLMPKITVVDARYTMEVRCRELQPYLYAYRGLLANRHLPSEYKETVMSLFLGHVLRSGITSRPVRDALLKLDIAADQLFDRLENDEDLSLSYRVLLCENLCRRSDVEEGRLREGVYKTLVVALKMVDEAELENVSQIIKLFERYLNRSETSTENLSTLAKDFIVYSGRKNSLFIKLVSYLYVACDSDSKSELQQNLRVNVQSAYVDHLEDAQNLSQFVKLMPKIFCCLYPDQNSMQLLLKGFAENLDTPFTAFPELDETDVIRRIISKAQSLSVRNWHVFSEVLISYAGAVQSNKQYDFGELEQHLEIYIKKLQSIWADGAAVAAESLYLKNSFKRLVEALLQAPHGVCKLLPLLVKAGSLDGIRCAIACMQIQQPAKSCLYQHAVEMALKLMKESEGLENNTAMALHIYKSCIKQPDFPLEKYAYEIFEDLFMFNPEQRANLLTYGLLHANDDYRQTYRYAPLMVDVALEMLHELEAVNMNDEVKILVRSLLISRHLDDVQRIDLALRYPDQCLEDHVQREYIFTMYLESAKIWEMPEAVNILDTLFQCGLRLNIDLETFIINLLEKVYAIPSGFNLMLDFLETHVDDGKLISVYSKLIRKNTLSKERLHQVIMNSENKSYLFQRNVSKAICQGTFSKLIKEATSEAG